MFTIIQSQSDSTDIMIIRSSQIVLFKKYDVLYHNLSLCDARDIICRIVQDRLEANAE